MTAESCTGGMVAAALTDIAGSSDVFERGYVTYSNLSKAQMLGVDGEAIAKHGAVSEEVALQMATGALKEAGADLSVAITGVAGPGGSENKPEGMVWFSVSTKHETLSDLQQFGEIGRERVRSSARDHALSMLLSVIEKPNY